MPPKKIMTFVDWLRFLNKKNRVDFSRPEHNIHPSIIIPYMCNQKYILETPYYKEIMEIDGELKLRNYYYPKQFLNECKVQLIKHTHIYIG